MPSTMEDGELDVQVNINDLRPAGSFGYLILKSNKSKRCKSLDVPISRDHLN